MTIAHLYAGTARAPASAYRPNPQAPQSGSQIAGRVNKIMDRRDAAKAGMTAHNIKQNSKLNTRCNTTLRWILHAKTGGRNPTSQQLETAATLL